MIHVNLSTIFYIHVEHSPAKTISIKYYMEKQTHACVCAHTHAHTHTCPNHSEFRHVWHWSVVLILAGAEILWEEESFQFGFWLYFTNQARIMCYYWCTVSECCVCFIVCLCVPDWVCARQGETWLAGCCCVSTSPLLPTSTTWLLWRAPWSAWCISPLGEWLLTLAPWSAWCISPLGESGLLGIICLHCTVSGC